MKVAITGANGFLGRHILNELVERNEEVKVLVRSAGSINTKGSNIEIITGDFTKIEDASRLLDGCEALIHVAGLTSMHWLDSDEFFRVNTKSTTQLVDLCRQKNIKRLVYVSTVNTIGYGTAEHAATETAPIHYPFTESWYAKSKKAAEELVEAFAQEEGNHVILIHPAFLIGDTDPATSSGKMIRMGYRKRLLVVPGGGKNFVGVEAVAQVCCNALHAGVNGTHYIAGGENLSFKSFFELLSRVGGYRQRILVLPDWMVKLAGKAGDCLRKMKIQTEISSRNLRQLLVAEFYSSEKAATELGMPEISIQKTLENALKK